MAAHRSPPLLAALTLLVVLTWLGWSFRHTRQSAYTESVPIEPGGKVQPDFTSSTEADTPGTTTSPSLNVEGLNLHAALCHYGVCNISPDALLSYAKVEINAVETPSFEAPLLQDLGINLPAFVDLDSTALLKTHAPSNHRATVHIPVQSAKVDASNFLCGVATNIDRLEDSLGQFAHWGSDNGARIIALVPQSSAEADIDRTLKKAEALKLNLLIQTSELGFDDRYFHLGELMHEQLRPDTAWTAFIDDDTFFPSMANLQDMLSKYPDPVNKPYYVGTLSEDLHQLFQWGYMAYGGGGVFLSATLLKQIRPHLEACFSLAHTGDSRIAQCIFSRTTTKLSPERDLWQIDLWGDASGFYEALRPQPISVHHWKSWHRFDMVNISRVSNICGDACIFQKFRFDDDWQLSNGFSLVQYSPGNERAADDQRMEKTFLDSQGGSLDMFLHSVSPLRPKDENKVQFMLEGAMAEDDTVRQFYVRRKHPENEKPTVQIMDIIWRKKGYV